MKRELLYNTKLITPQITINNVLKSTYGLGSLYKLKLKERLEIKSDAALNIFYFHI